MTPEDMRALDSILRIVYAGLLAGLVLFVVLTSLID